VNSFIHNIALIASVVLPLWNIPLIVRMINRKSSKDISTYWAFGVWCCLVLMAPAGLMSSDIVWRVFIIANLSIFSIVVFTVVYYRVKKGTDKNQRA